MSDHHVHYLPDNKLLALCGDKWVFATDDPAKVTCPDCLKLMAKQGKG